MKKIFFVLFLVFFNLSVGCTETDDSFYLSEDNKGFYWYKDEKIPTEKEIDPEKLWLMPPSEFKELFTKTIDKAVQFPTQDNVYDYLVMQDISKKKATQFASVVKLMGLKHPEFSNETIYPISKPGQVARFKEITQEIRKTISDNKDKFALIMFSEEGCSWCTEQEKILSYFTRQFGWQFRKIPLNTGLAQQYSIDQVPAIILVQRFSKVGFPVAHGIISMDELEGNIFQSIMLANQDIKPEQFGLSKRSRGSNLKD